MKTRPARPPASRPASPDGFSFEQLEPREMLTISTVNDIPNITTAAMGPNYTLSLLGRYTDSFVTQVVRLSTNAGNIDLALRGDWAPNTVANFLQYVNEGFYNNTIFHRSQRPTPQFNYGLIQGGGFRPPTTDYNGTVNATNQPQLIPTGNNPGEVHSPIDLEHPTGNFAYTLGLARTQDPNSGSSQFYINTIDNRGVFDAAVNPPGYATFGQVLPFTRGTVDTISGYTYYDASQAFNSALSNLPLVRPAPLTLPVTPADYVTITNAALLNDLSGVETVGWTATVTSGANIGSVSIVNGNLVITPTAARIRGTMSINVRVDSIDGVSTINDTFTFTIDNYAPVIGGMQAQSNVAVGQTMLLSAFGVNDPDAATGGGLSGVEFWYDANDDGALGNGDVLLGSDALAAGGWNARVDTSAMQAGANRVFARVTDTDGEVATTSRIVTLRAGVPGAGVTPGEASATPGQNVNLGFNPELPSNTGIRRVSIFIDTDNSGTFNPGSDRLLGYATFSNGSWAYTISGADLQLGANRIFARVTDNYGNLGAVSSSIITVGIP